MSTSEAPSEGGHPLDLVEIMLGGRNWSVQRMAPDELFTEIAGQWCDYQAMFAWRDDISALHLTLAFDVRLPDAARRGVYELLALANDRLWIGHFDLTTDVGLPSFRHTILLRGSTLSAEQIEDLIDIALNEAERFYPAFQFVVWGGRAPAEALASSILDPVGEA